MPKTEVKVKLTGTDGNAFALIGKVTTALRKNGHKDLVKEFQEKAMSGDYDNLLATCCEYVDIS